MEGQCSYFVTSPHLAVLDTGAVNGVIGTTQFLILCQMLQRHGLHASIDRECAGAPSSIGGIGGGAEVVCTAQTPTAVAGIPGIISFIVITGEVPALLPLPLMRALGGVLDFPRQRVLWTQHDEAESQLIDLPSGHIGCSILDGVEKFGETHPSAEHFSKSPGALDDLRWVRQQAFALTKRKNEKKAVHFALEREPFHRSCLSPSPQQEVHGPPTGRGVARAIPAENSDPSTVRDHCRPKCTQLMDQSHASRSIGSADSFDAGCDMRAQSIGDSGCWSDSKVIHEHATHHHDGASESRAHLLSQPSQTVERDVSWSGIERLCTPSATSQGERSCEVVQLHGVSDEMAEGGWRVPDAGTVSLESLEQECIEELYECSWVQATTAECASLSKCYYELLQVPEVQFLSVAQAFAAWKTNADDFTGKCRCLNQGLDTVLRFQPMMSELQEQEERTVYLLERFGEEAALQAEPPTPSDIDLVSMVLATEVPREWRFRDAVLKVHPPWSKGQIQAVPITFHVFAHRAQMLTRTSGKPIYCQDVWPVMGRKKREKSVEDNACAVVSFFARTTEAAASFMHELETRQQAPMSWPNWMKPVVDQPPWESSLAQLAFQPLCAKLFEVLKTKNMPPQHRALNAIKEGAFTTCTLGASTQRGPRVTVATRDLEWKEVMTLVHELARRRPDYLQHPYLAVSINHGGASAHCDQNDSWTTILGIGQYQGGALRVAGQRTLSVKGNWKAFDAGQVHETLDHQGERYTISVYVPRKPELLKQHQLDELRKWDFPVDWFLHEFVWRQQHESPQIFAEDDVEVLGGGSDEIRPPRTESLEDAISVEVPTSAQQRAIHRAHCNLGHCSVQKLARAGVRHGVRLWTLREFRCNECEQRGRVVRRLAALARSYQFNQVVGVDTVHIHIEPYPAQAWLNVVCYGTRFQQLYFLPLESDVPTAEAALEALETGWFTVFGLPETILTDLGSEFKGVFAQKCEEEGIIHLTINSKSPWEQGITERAGGVLKEQVRLAAEATEPTSSMEVRQLIRYCVIARNQHSDRSGYAPAQRVYGQLPTFPADMVSDAYLDQEVLALNTRQEQKRSADIRMEARIAFFRLQEKTRFQRAVRASTVPQPEFKSGEMVFVLRRNTLGKQWREGPGLVVQVLGSTAWVAIRGELLKCSKLALMKATSEDQRGVEAVKEHLPDLLSDLSRQRKVRDVTHEEERLPTTPATPATAAIPRTPATTAIPATPASKRRVEAEADPEQSSRGVEEESRQSRRRLAPGVQARGTRG
eukprot:5276297-Amphidinium_carterae.1